VGRTRAAALLDDGWDGVTPPGHMTEENGGRWSRYWLGFQHLAADEPLGGEVVVGDEEKAGVEADAEKGLD